MRRSAAVAVTLRFESQELTARCRNWDGVASHGWCAVDAMDPVNHPGAAAVEDRAVPEGSENERGSEWESARRESVIIGRRTEE